MGEAVTMAAGIPAPQPGIEPLKANVFWSGRQANSQLLPIFPFDGPGAIIPTLGVMAGGATGYFLHFNTVDEVVVSWGGRGAARTGDVFVGQRTHGVGEREKKPDLFAVTTVTQRQLEAGAQTEAIVFTCEKCTNELFRYDFDTTPVISEPGRRYPPLGTIRGTFEAATKFNDSEDLRTCGRCGHATAPFPIGVWGWQRYMYNTDVVERARRVFDEATKSC